MKSASWLLPSAFLLAACTDVTTELIPQPGPGEAPPEPDAASLPEAQLPPPGPRERVMCGDRPCRCDNGEDDDGDGEVDGLDPECTGPYDDDEGSFATGIPGNNMDFCHDCFWDANSGSDDDGCQYHEACRLGQTPTGPSSAPCFRCEVSEECASTCGERTPNGCDCFGCCEVHTPAGPVYAILTDSCALKDIDDETKCPRCVQTSACMNPCGTCELCPGKRQKDLPPECRGPRRPMDEPPQHVCEGGQQVCSEREPCPVDYYCQLGCCLYVPE